MESSKQKQPKIKVFQLILEHLANAGICSDLVLQPYPFNRKIFKNFLILLLYIICSVMYLFYEAKTFTENTGTIYMGSVSALITIALLILVFSVKKMFKFINSCEEIANTSKFLQSTHNYFVDFLN